MTILFRKHKMTILDFFISCWKKLAVAERLFWQLGMHSNGHCHCREVLIRINVWTIRRERWPFSWGGRKWRFDCSFLHIIMKVFSLLVNLSVYLENSTPLYLSVWRCNNTCLYVENSPNRTRLVSQFEPWLECLACFNNIVTCCCCCCFVGIFCSYW